MKLFFEIVVNQMFYICSINSFYSVAALLAMQSAVIATAIPSVRLSVTRWYCTQTNEDRIIWSSS